MFVEGLLHKCSTTSYIIFVIFPPPAAKKVFSEENWIFFLKLYHFAYIFIKCYNDYWTLSWFKDILLRNIAKYYLFKKVRFFRNREKIQLNKWNWNKFKFFSYISFQMYFDCPIFQRIELRQKFKNQFLIFPCKSRFFHEAF